MDPMALATAAVELATVALRFSEKIWDATPADLKTQEAGNWAKFLIATGDTFLAAQKLINGALPK